MAVSLVKQNCQKPKNSSDKPIGDVAHLALIEKKNGICIRRQRVGGFGVWTGAPS